MTQIPVPTKLFPAQTRLERRIHAALLGAGSDPERRLSVMAAPDAEEVTAQFLRWVLLEAIPKTRLPIREVALYGARIVNSLDLDASKLAIPLSFRHCRFVDWISLNDAELARLRMISCRMKGIKADRLTVKGAVEIRGGRPEDPAQGQSVIDNMLRLCGAKIHGNLNLEGTRLLAKEGQGEDRIALHADGLTVDGNVRLCAPFRSEGELRLDGSVIHRDLDCTGAELVNPGGYTLSAAGARINGSVYLVHAPEKDSTARPFVSQGCVRFEGAKVIGELDCSGGQFTAGAFLLPGWEPASDNSGQLYAIAARDIEVSAGILLSGEGREGRGFAAKGVVDLTDARVGANLDCREADFSFPGEEPVCADGIVVSGATFLDKIRTDGMLRFKQANLKQGCYLREAKFDASKASRQWLKEPNLVRYVLDDKPSCGIYAPGAEVGGTFYWQGVCLTPDRPRRQFEFWLYLAWAKANTVDDDEPSWTQLDRFDVTGCQYVSMSKINGDPGWRLQVLDREYAAPNRKMPDGTLIEDWVDARGAKVWRWVRACAIFLLKRGVGAQVSFAALCRAFKRAWWLDRNGGRLEPAIKRFKPQPYLQLVKIFRSAGYEKAANKVLVGLERNRTRYSDFSFFRQTWRWLLDIFLLYGLSPFRPVAFLLLWMLVSAGFFEIAYHKGRIVAVKEPSKPEMNAKAPPPAPAFNAIVYAIDSLVPIVDFNQKKAFTIEPLSAYSAERPKTVEWRQAAWEAVKAAPYYGVALLMVFNTFFGWLMTSLFVAGVSGLLRTARDG